MKNVKLLIMVVTIIIVSSTISSCEDDTPAPMKWEFSDYNHEAVSAFYSPEFYNQVTIFATSDYTGDITLKCTNYNQLTLRADNANEYFTSEVAGFTVRKVDENTFIITFEAIENGISDFVSIDGRNANENNVTNMSVTRITNDSNYKQDWQ